MCGRVTRATLSYVLPIHIHGAHDAQYILHKRGITPGSFHRLAFGVEATTTVQTLKPKVVEPSYDDLHLARVRSQRGRTRASVLHRPSRRGRRFGASSVRRGVVLGTYPGKHLRLRVTSDAASGSAARHRSYGIFTVWTPLSAAFFRSDRKGDGHTRHCGVAARAHKESPSAMPAEGSKG